MKALMFVLTMLFSMVTFAQGQVVEINNEVKVEQQTKKLTKKQLRKLEMLEMERSQQELLAMIPRNHPYYKELRIIAQQPIPKGYSNVQWLTMAMKIDFVNGVGKQNVVQQTENM